MPQTHTDIACVPTSKRVGAQVWQVFPAISRRRKVCVGQWLIILNLAGWCPGAEPVPDAPVQDVLAQLEKNFADVKTLRTDFVQEKHLAIFAQTIYLRGSLFLQKPDRLAWHMQEPVRYMLVLAGQTLRQWDEESNQVQQTPLSANPILQVVAEQLRRWFGGEYTGLTKLYDVSVAGRSPTSLEFKPRKDSMTATAVKSVRVTFREDERYLSALTIEEPNGDRTSIVFTNTVMNPVLGESVWEVKPHAK